MMSGSVMAISRGPIVAGRDGTLRARGGLARGRGAIALRSVSEIEAIRAAGAVVEAAIDAAASACVPGTTTRAIDAAAAAVLDAAGARSLFLHFPSYERGEGFPAVACISVNEEVVHGVPGDRRIESCDIVTIDCGAQLDGWCADAARTVAVGEVTLDIRCMIAVAEAVLEAAVEMIRPGLLWSDVARIMQQMGEEGGYGVVTKYVGHGIGRELHEPPQAPCFVTRRFLRHGDFTLLPGMVLAIEPMLTLGGSETRVMDDGWTVVTADGSPACHVEHTVAVTRTGAAVLAAGSLRSNPARGATRHG